MAIPISYKRLCVNASMASAIIGVALIVVYFVCGHAILKLIYDSNLPVFQGLMSGKAMMSLQSYYPTVDQGVLALATGFIVGAGVLLLMMNPLGLLCSTVSLFICSLGIFLVLDLFPSLVKPLHFDMIPYFNYRLTYIPDPVLGFRERPHYTATIANFRGFGYSPLYGVYVQPQMLKWSTDEDGFRNESQVSRADVVVIGSSFPEYGVDSEDTYPSRLEKALGGKPVVNFSKAGYGPIEYVKVFERYALKKHPKYAIFALNVAGDVDEHLRDWVAGRTDSGLAKRAIVFGSFFSRYHLAVQQSWQMLASASWTALQLGFANILGSNTVHPDVAVLKLPNNLSKKIVFLDRHLDKTPDELLRSRQWLALKQILVAFKRLSEQHGIVPLLLYIPGASEIYSQYSTPDSGANWLKMRNALIATSGSNEEATRRLAVDMGLQLISLRPAFEQAAAQGKLLYYSLDSHWNAEGREIAAQTTAKALKALRSHAAEPESQKNIVPMDRRNIDPVLREAKVNGKNSIMLRTLDGTISSWNDSAEQLYGWKKEEAMGRVSHDLLRTQFPEPLEKIDAELERKGRWEGKLIHATRDGRSVVVDSRWILDRKKHPGLVMEINRPSGNS